MSGLRDACVLVTGVGGFVGPHLARALVARGAEVHGLGLGAPPADAPVASFRECDLADGAGLGDAFAAVAPAVVVHLAGQSSAARSFVEPEETFRANLGGTRAVLEAVLAAAPRARVVIVTTSEIYGPCTAPGERVREDAPFRPVSPYGRSKAEADELARSFGAEHDMDVVRARPFGHAGPGQTPRFVIPGWAQQIARIEAGLGEAVLRVGDLEIVRDLSDVRDVVEGYCALIERARTGEAYNLCRGEGVRLADVVQRFAAMARVPVRIERDPQRMRPADLPVLVGDPTRMRVECGWQVTIPLERTLAEVLEEWRART